ncbi:MAG: response regulator [Desulfobacterales bacterium]|nr:response regulator [Desulfobacterales bacterium]
MYNIMVVENDIKLRQRIKAILELKLPFVSVIEASDAKQTLKRIKQHHPEFILVDIRLAKENGLILAEKIKKEYPNIIITINSNCDTPEYQAEAKKVGADYFLSKKTNTIQDLLKLVQSIHSGSNRHFLNQNFSDIDNCEKR